MSDPTTALYMIMGVVVRGLYDLGERPIKIRDGFDAALTAVCNPDPVIDQASEQFARTLTERLAR